MLVLSNPVDCCSTISVWVHIEEMEATRKYLHVHFTVFTYDGGIPGEHDISSPEYIQVLFPGGTTRAKFDVYTKDDVLFEPNERFSISVDPLSLPHGVVLGSIPRATVSITDNDSK